MTFDFLEHQPLLINAIAIHYCTQTKLWEGTVPKGIFPFTGGVGISYASWNRLHVRVTQ